MEHLTERLCRFCSNSINNNFIVVDDTSIQILGVLLKRDFGIDEQTNQVTCSTCYEKLHAAFDFKSACLCTEDSLCPYVDSGMETVDLREIYTRQNVISLPEDEKICRLCMRAIRECIPVHKLMVDMLEKYIPEVNLGITKDPVICKTCLRDLISHSNFINSFDDNRTLKNIDEKTIDNKAQISHFNLHIKSEIEEGGEKIFIETREHVTVEGLENKMSDEPFIKTEAIEIKSENTEERVQSQELDKVYHEDPVKGPIAENVSSVGKCHIERKRRKKRNTQLWFKCDECDYKTNYKFHLKKHTLIHKDASEVESYHCALCTYTSKIKDNLRQHMVLHRDPSKIKTYDCNTCDYKATRCSQLKNHLLLHKDPSEIVWHKCDKCDSKFKRKGALKRHMLVHRDASEVEWYLCHLCNHRSKTKYNLKLHLMIHTDVSEI